MKVQVCGEEEPSSVIWDEFSRRKSLLPDEETAVLVTVNVSNEEVFQAVIPRREKSKMSKHTRTRTATGVTMSMRFY